MPRILAQLEQELPPWSEVRLFQRERELVDGGAAVEVETCSVRIQEAEGVPLIL